MELLGTVLAVLGIGLAVILSGVGSAIGVGRAGRLRRVLRPKTRISL